MSGDDAELERLIEEFIAKGNKPFEWKGELSFFELAIASIDGAIMRNQTRPLDLAGAMSHAITHARHEHNVSYFICNHPEGCDEAGLIKACQTLDISPDVARFALSLANARIKNRKNANPQNL